MKKLAILCILIFLSIPYLIGCERENNPPKIGVSFGVNNSTRWVAEKKYMENRAKELGIDIETRLNTDEKVKAQYDDCREMIDNGISVLILRIRDVKDAPKIVEYARKHNVKIIAYTRLIYGQNTDLFIGYDCERIGQQMGKHLAELVPKGDYIILSGEVTDKSVSPYIYAGAMRYLNQSESNINIILDANVPLWSPTEAKKMVKEAIESNNNKIDAIFAPNDKIAAACAEAITELGITAPVAISGMDADLSAAKRIIAGTQSCTIYMYLKELSDAAVTEAYHMALTKKVNTNAEFDNETNTSQPSLLISGQLVTRQNLDRILIDSGYFTREQVYGEEK